MRKIIGSFLLIGLLPLTSFATDGVNDKVVNESVAKVGSSEVQPPCEDGAAGLVSGVASGLEAATLITDGASVIRETSTGAVTPPPVDTGLPALNAQDEIRQTIVDPRKYAKEEGRALRNIKRWKNYGDRAIELSESDRLSELDDLKLYLQGGREAWLEKEFVPTYHDFNLRWQNYQNDLSLIQDLKNIKAISGNSTKLNTIAERLRGNGFKFTGSLSNESVLGSVVRAIKDDVEAQVTYLLANYNVYQGLTSYLKAVASNTETDATSVLMAKKASEALASFKSEEVLRNYFQNP
ncbi:MAG: hypothetical protein JWL77_7094, partial [Chthonomonadaceae bacterium]|nr:hypothetical protein [Chthonomonadaceae bacterium]